MKKYVFILMMFFVLTSFLTAEPYKPYPILWIHGLGSHALTWGADYHKLPNGFRTDSIIGFGDSPTYQYFLDYMDHYAWVLDTLGYDTTYTKPGGVPNYPNPDPAYPNKTFLEVINMDDNWGSVDPDPENYPSPYEGQGDELAYRIVEVLEEYYGDDWASNPDAKVILISHSLGGLATREALKERPDLIPHIARVITVDTPHLGSRWATPYWRDLWIMIMGKWHPMVLPLSFLISKGISNLTGWITDKLAECGAQFTIEGMLPAIFNLVNNSIFKNTPIGDYLKLTAMIKLTILPTLDDYGLPYKRGAVPDVAQGSPFINNVGTSGAGQIKFVSIRGKDFLYSEDYWSVWYNIFKPGALNASWALFIYYAMILKWDWIAKGTASLLLWDNLNDNYDFLVGLRSQNINSVSSSYKAEVLTNPSPIFHMAAQRKYNMIVKALEERPVIYLDSVITIEGTFPISGTIDTVSGHINGFKGRLDDYFLAENEFEISVNYFLPYPIEWPERLGYKDNCFQIESDTIKFRTYNGWNHFEFISKNIAPDDPVVKKTYNILVLGGPMVVVVYPGWNEAINPKNDTLYSKASFSDSIGLDCVQLAIDDPGPDSFVTVFDTVYEDTVLKDVIKYMMNPPYFEGEYKLHWWCSNIYSTEPETTHAFSSFYIDTTPPEIEIILPDTVVNVFSPRVDSAMPIAFNGTDNLQEKLNQPQGDSVIIQIYNSVDSIIKDTSSTSYFYGVTRLIYWNFIDNNGQKIMESGEYKVVVSLSDRAGNKGSYTASFFIDTEPPQIELTQPLSPDTFTANETFIEMRYLTNEWTEMNVTFTNYQDTTQKYASLAYGDSTDIDSNGVQDTCFFFEGPGVLGEYIPDGRYAVDVIVKDRVGNDTTISDPLGGGKDTLYVDRTRPQIYQAVCKPWIVEEDNKTSLEFILSEEWDADINRKGVEAIITIDDTSIVDVVTMTAVTDTFEVGVNLTGFEDGVHRIGVKATDWCGNIKTAMATTVKGTIGAMFTMPSDGDTIPRGYVTLKGFAVDPDMGNYYGFEKYEIYYRTHSGKDTRDKSRYSPERGVPTGWKSAGIEVPPNMREPGGPLNRSIVEVTQNSTLAYWNTSVAGTGFFDLLLVSTEKQTGKTIADTITVNIGIEEVINPSVSIDSVFHSPFYTDMDSILTIEYSLTDKAGNVSMDIVNPRDEVVFHNKHYNVIPYEGTPSTKSDFGFYFYKEDTVWYIYWSNPDTTLPASFTGTIEGIDSGTFNVVDTTNLGEDASFTLGWNTIDFSAISQGGLNGLGFTSTFARMQLTLTVNGISSEEYVFLGTSKAKASCNPICCGGKEGFLLGWKKTEWCSCAYKKNNKYQENV